MEAAMSESIDLEQIRALCRTYAKGLGAQSTYAFMLGLGAAHRLADAAPALLDRIQELEGQRDTALGRCQQPMQCHHATGHQGDHEARQPQ
jgi:hypothetical protein